MKREKYVVVVARLDPVSLVHFERTIDQLRDGHPRHTFVDFRDVTDAAKHRGKGLGNIFALLERNEVDIIVANACELPLRLPVCAAIAAIPERGNPFDVLIARDELILDEQPEHVRLGVTDEVSRVQLLYYRPDLVLREEKSGVEALNRLMAEDEIDGFVTAAAEVEALNQQEHVVEVFTSSICTPMAGQGALSLLTRKNDRDALAATAILNDPSSLAEVMLERMFLGVVSRDGRVPVGVLAKMEGDTFEIEAAITAPDGSEKVTGAIDGVTGQEKEIIGRLVEDLLASGGGRIIKAHR